MKRSIFLFGFLFTASLLFSVVTLHAQQHPPFWKDIQAFKKQDSIAPPPKNAILFIGSSSFTNWKDVQDYFPGYTIINRGFGGSTLPDLIRYADDVIFPYQPKQIVIYCGDNDLASSKSITADSVLARFKTLYGMIRSELGKKVNVVYVAIKPSISRKHLMPEMEEANALIQDFLNKEKNTAFADVYHKMLDENGQPMPDIFLADNLHMNAKGYAIWQKILQPLLIKK